MACACLYLPLSMTVFSLTFTDTPRPAGFIGEWADKLAPTPINTAPWRYTLISPPGWAMLYTLSGKQKERKKKARHFKVAGCLLHIFQ